MCRAYFFLPRTIAFRQFLVSVLQDLFVPVFNTLVRIIVTGCMFSVEYFCSESVSRGTFGHYGLASSIYTRFTTPIVSKAGIQGSVARSHQVYTDVVAYCCDLTLPAACLALLQVECGAYLGRDQLTALDGGSGSTLV
jgi:hypothetical protein